MKHKKNIEENLQSQNIFQEGFAEDAGKVENEVKEMNENLEAEQMAAEQASETSEPDNGQTAGENAELENLKKQSDDYFNRLARLQADFENYKKRVAKEREDMYQFALESIMKQILPVVDNMERAACAFKNDQLDAKYCDGVEMVVKQLVDVLSKNGLKEIEALEQEFDPNLHHAVMQVEAEDEDDNKVKEVLQKGYQLGCRVIRPSLVKVATK